MESSRYRSLTRPIAPGRSVCGRKIEAVTKDAGATSESALAAFSALKGEDVVGLSLVQGAQPVNVVRPEVEKLDMPAVPTTWGASLLASKNYMMVGTTYQRQGIGAIDWLVEKTLLASGDAIGVAYLSGAYGGAVLAGIEHGAKVNGITVTSASVEPTATDLSGTVSTFHAKKVKAIFLAGTPDQTSSTTVLSQALVCHGTGRIAPADRPAPVRDGSERNSRSRSTSGRT